MTLERALEIALATVRNKPALKNCPGFGMEDRNPDNRFFWFYPENEDDLETLSLLFKSDACGEDYHISRNYINRWMCLEVSDDEYVYHSDFDEMVKYAVGIINELGFDLELKNGKYKLTQREEMNDE